MFFRAGSYFRPYQADIQADIEEELQAHLEIVAEELKARGYNDNSARSAAENRFGNYDRIFDECLAIQMRGRRMRRKVQLLFLVGGAVLLLSLPAPHLREESYMALAALDRNEPWASRKVVAAGVETVPTLIQRLQNQDLERRMRMCILNILGEIGSKRALPTLLQSLQHPSCGVRRCAAAALGKLGDTRARSSLEWMAENDPFRWPDPQSGEWVYWGRMEAQLALAQMESVENFP